MKERAKKVFGISATVLLAGLLYWVFYKKTGIGIPCLFYTVTGLYCPGCGITRMFSFLLQGEIQQAMKCNPVLFSVLPILASLLAGKMIRYVRTGKRDMAGWQNVLLYVMITVLCMYAVVRNFFRITL